jgi:hypothetical protein
MTSSLALASLGFQSCSAWSLFNGAASEAGETGMSKLRQLLTIGVAVLATSCGLVTAYMGYPDDYYLMGRSRSPLTPGPAIPAPAAAYHLIHKP